MSTAELEPRNAASGPPARQVAGAAAELIEQAFGLHRLSGDADCGREELLLGDLCFVSAAELVAGIRRPDAEAAFSRAAMTAATGGDPTALLARAVDIAGSAAPESFEPPASPVIASDESDTMDRLEARLVEILDEDPDAVSEPMGRLLRAGGKRIRPRLSYIWSSVGPRHNPGRAATMGCVFEFIHDAALVHDDIVDESPLRRGQPAVHVAFGVPTAVRVGDYYFGRAAQLLAELCCFDATRLSIDAVVKVCRAQLEEYQSRGGEGVDEARYLRTVEGKTAALFSGACAAGAALAGADERVVQAAADYGLELGVAFQVADDLVDFLPTSGKPLLQDLRQEVFSLPLLYAMQDPEAGPRLRAIRDGDGVDSGEAADLVRRSGAMAAARRMAEDYRDRALGRLEVVRDEDARAALAEIAITAVDRDS